MKTLFTLSLLPVIVIAYLLSAKLYEAADYVSAYAMMTVFFSSVVYCIYRAGAMLQKQRA
jgi:hypothetical protein